MRGGSKNRLSVYVGRSKIKLCGQGKNRLCERGGSKIELCVEGDRIKLCVGWGNATIDCVKGGGRKNKLCGEGMQK